MRVKSPVESGKRGGRVGERGRGGRIGGTAGRGGREGGIGRGGREERTGESRGGVTVADSRRPQRGGLAKRGRGTGRGSSQGSGEVRRRGPLKLSERPRWGAAAASPNSRPTKQSDRDPCYERRLRRTQPASVERQRELQALANENSPRAAAETTVASRARSRSRSPGGAPCMAREAMARARDAFSQQDVYSQYQRRPAAARPGPGPDSGRAPPGQHIAPHRPELHVARPCNADAERSVSPPVAATRHRAADGRAAADKYGDASPVDAPLQGGDFVPFIRSVNVLDPARADSPIIVSRENSATQKARVAYMQETAPATFGNMMQNLNDRRTRDWKARHCRRHSFSYLESSVATSSLINFLK